ncbi:hypothetical protein [Chryseobacterium sp.]|uniref:hypothetical protein n=1 Tax=Chryseobacterium sp. TaxID=1871047 RepID=UPI0011CC80A6|nr:hypothetical protein [Chryseobacterium sp.]TXF78916.1 hypothetical protein FUA25_00540 [Chryseobacterium sp.]
MDNNNFEKSEDLNSVERNIDNNPDHNTETDAEEQGTTRIKDVRNPVITQENFVKDAENAVPPLAWENQKKAYKDAWENNRNQNLED